MPISPGRASAFDVLMRIEKTDAYASELLHSSRLAGLSAADHGLATELVMGVLRWRDVLDEHIAERSNQSVSRLDTEVLTALRMGVYQLLFLDRVPRHAAVNESVEIVKRARKRSASGLVNAVLRKIDSKTFHPQSRAAHPQWMLERWSVVYGTERMRAICEYDQRVPETALRFSDAANTGARPDLDQLHFDRVQLAPGRLLVRAAIVTAGDITGTNAFREHRLVIQDEASQLVALLAGRGERILDCCAAPGGKTRILAERNPRATVVAMELHTRRAALLKKLVPAPNVQIVAGDARRRAFSTNFDRILVDAPCTGTGTLARNPEIKWRLKPEDIDRMRSYQLEILNSASSLLAPGGRLVYSTCSLEPEENEGVVENLLSGSFKVVGCRGELERLRSEGELVWKDIDGLCKGAYLRTMPGVHPCDGFFAAILERK